MSLLCCINTTYVTIYVVLHLVTYYFCINVLQKGNLKHKNDKEFIQKYRPFVRNDLDKWDMIKTFPWYITYWPRFIACMLNLTVYGIMVKLITLGANVDELGPWRKSYVTAHGKLANRL